jgi:hypothetical protein
MQTAVFQKGGSLGENRDNVYNGKKIVKTFGQDKEGAKAYAKRMRSYLSKGEKAYYGLGYTTGPCPENITVN